MQLIDHLAPIRQATQVVKLAAHVARRQRGIERWGGRAPDEDIGQ